MTTDLLLNVPESSVPELIRWKQKLAVAEDQLLSADSKLGKHYAQQAVDGCVKRITELEGAALAERRML